MLCFVSGLITEVLLHGKFMGTFCSQTWIYFPFLFAHLCVCDTGILGDTDTHTLLISLWGWPFRAQLSTVSASVPACRQMEMCTSMKKRCFIQNYVAAVLQRWSSLTVKASWNVTLVVNVPAIQTHHLQVFYFPFFLLMGGKFAPSPVQVTDNAPGDSVMVSPEGQSWHGGNSFPTCDCHGIPGISGCIQAGSTDTSQAVCSSHESKGFEYPASWTPRASKDGDST